MSNFSIFFLRCQSVWMRTRRPPLDSRFRILNFSNNYTFGAAVWSSCVNCEFSPRALWTGTHSLNRHNRILPTPRFSEEKEKKVNWKTHSKIDISAPSLHILDWPKGTNQLMFLLAWTNISSQKYKNPQNIQKGKQKGVRILALHWDNVSENQVCVSVTGKIIYNGMIFSFDPPVCWAFG